MAKYVRSQAVPRFQWGASTGKLFKWLSPESKERVYSSFYEWFNTARKRDAIVPVPNTEGLNEQESDTLIAMCSDTTEGIEGYWNECNRNAGNRNSRIQQGDHGSTTGRQKNERERDRKNDNKLLRSQQYEQREYNEEEMRKILGTDDLFK